MSDYKGVSIGELRKMVKASAPKPKDMKRAELISILGGMKKEPDVVLMVEMPKEEPKKDEKKKEKKEPKKEPKKEDKKKETHGAKVKSYMSKHAGVSLAEASKIVAKK